MTQLTGRDYKRRSRGTDPSRWRDFGAGVLVGVTLTAVLFGVMRRHHSTASAREHAQVHHTAPASTAAANVAANATGADTGVAKVDATHYDFYQMLPHFEVVVPDKEHPVSPEAPRTPIKRPGVYVLQAGSYRRAADARRVAKRLAVLGLDAKVQRVSVDTDVWYRVRVGPIRHLTELNHLRHKLEAAHVDSLVIRVGN